MKLHNLLFLSFILFGFTSKNSAFHERGASPIEPLKSGEKLEPIKNPKELRELQERLDVSQERGEKLLNAEKTLEKLQQKQSYRNLSTEETNELTEVTKLLDNTVDNNFLQTYKQAQELLEQYKTAIAKLEDLPAGVGVLEFQSQKVNQDFVKAVETRDTTAINALNDIINNINIENALTKERDYAKQLDILTQNRFALENLKELTAQEIKLRQNDSNSAYTSHLKDFHTTIVKQLAQLDVLNVQQINKNASYWKTIATKVTDAINAVLKKINSVKTDFKEALVLIKNSFKAGIGAVRVQSVKNDIGRAIENTQQFLNATETLITEKKSSEIVKIQKEGVLTALKESIDSFRNLLDTNLGKAIETLQNLQLQLNGTANRYKGTHATLFEKIQSDLVNNMNAIGMHDQVDKIYEIIGLDASKRSELTQQSIETAVANAIEKAGTDLQQLNKISIAEKILKNPVERATYDAFLSDIALLKDRHTGNQTIDVNSLSITPLMRETLQGGSGSLRALEIPENVYENIVEAQDEIGAQLQTATQEQLGSISEAFGTPHNTLREQLDALLDRITNAEHDINATLGIPD